MAGKRKVRLTRVEERPKLAMHDPFRDGTIHKAREGLVLGEEKVSVAGKGRLK